MPTAAVIGCGDVSSVHFGAIAKMDDVELVAVCDTDAGRLQAATAAYGVPGYADYLEMLEIGEARRRAYLHSAPPACLAGCGLS